MKFTTGFNWPHNLISSGATNQSTFNLNGSLSGGYSQNWLFCVWVPLHNGTISKIRVYASAVAGTLGASDLVCDIYSVSAGVPNTSLQSSSTVTATPTGAAWVEFTGFSVAVTPGTPYAVVLRNADPTPTTNSITYRYLSNGNVNISSTTAPPVGQTYIGTSTNSGSSWSISSNVLYVVIDYGGSVYEGFAASATSTVTVYSSREAGIMYVLPQGVNVVGVSALVYKTGSPTGNLRYRIYTGSGASPTLVGTTGTLAPADVNTSSSGSKPLYFSSPITLMAGTTIRIVVSETAQSDASGQNYTLSHLTLDTMNVWYPLTSVPKRTLSTDGGATFSETNNSMPQITLLLDAEDPFPAPADVPAGTRFNRGFN